MSRSNFTAQYFQAKIEEKEKALAKKTKLEKRARREEETNRLREEETKAKLEAAAKLKAAVAGMLTHSHEFRVRKLKPLRLSQPFFSTIWRQRT